VELEALRALQYEGTPAEIALDFKERGNEMVQIKRWGDGKEFYTKGIAVLTQKKTAKTNGSREGGDADTDCEEEWRKENQIEEACYVNRALCNLELSTAFSTVRVLYNSNIPYMQIIIDPRPSTPHPPSASTQGMSKATTAPPSLSSRSTKFPKHPIPALAV